MEEIMERSRYVTVLGLFFAGQLLFPATAPARGGVARSAPAGRVSSGSATRSHAPSVSGTRSRGPAIAGTRARAFTGRPYGHGFSARPYSRGFARPFARGF